MAIPLLGLAWPAIKTLAELGVIGGTGYFVTDHISNIKKYNDTKALLEAGGPIARSSSDSLNMYQYMSGMRRRALNHVDAINEKLKTDKDNPELLKELQEWQESADAWDADMWEIGYELGLPGYRRKFSPIFDPRNLGESEQDESNETDEANQSDLPSLDSEYENYDPFYFMKNLPNDPTISKNSAFLDKDTVQNAASLLGLNNDYSLSLAASRAQQQRFWDNFKI